MELWKRLTLLCGRDLNLEKQIVGIASTMDESRIEREVRSTKGYREVENMSSTCKYFKFSNGVVGVAIPPEDMKVDHMPLDYATFQLLPKCTRCEAFVSASGRIEKVASVLLKPFLLHSRAAEEQMDQYGHLIKLELKPENQNASASWFNKVTFKRTAQSGNLIKSNLQLSTLLIGGTNIVKISPNGILAPRESIVASVVKFVEKPEHEKENKTKDKFKIVILKVKEGTEYTPELFEEHKGMVAVERVLQVVFLYPQRPSQKELEKLKKRLAEAEAIKQAQKKPSG
eukprot:Gb_03797 [translate_table: standard]